MLRIDGDVVVEALELASREDIAVDQVVELAIRPSVDDALRHARGDAGQLLDAADRGGVEIEPRGRVRRALAPPQGAPERESEQGDEDGPARDAHAGAP